MKFIKNIWPVKRHELKKFFFISFLMFFILLNQNILRILKDTILISELNAELISFTRLYCVTPLAAIVVIIYTKLLNNISLKKIFYYFIFIFTFFYLFFAFFLYPNNSGIHFSPETILELTDSYPYLKWYIVLVGNWSYVLFYSFCELWPNVFYVLFFWQFVNEISSTNEAKRFYTLFAFIGNSSLLVVGLFMGYLNSDNIFYQVTDVRSKLFMVKVAMTVLSMSSITCCVILHKLSAKFPEKNTFSKSGAKEIGEVKAITHKTKYLENEKMSLVQSFKYILKSKYLWLMFVCSASFNTSMDFVEGIWRAKIKVLYPNISDFGSFNSKYIFWTGVVIMIFTLLGNGLIRKYKWLVSAIITPLIILITGIIFFVLIIFQPNIAIFSIQPLVLAVYTGTIQNVLSKGIKFSIWDSAIQMLYIPLDRQLRTRGKAAVDVASPKIGKSFSSFVQTAIFTFSINATYFSIAPLLLGIFLCICLFWIYSVYRLNIRYEELIKN